MASAYDKASLVMLPHAVKEDKLYSVKPEDRSGDFTFSRGSDIQATRVNSSGLIEKAKVNLLEQSNTFSTGWGIVSASVTGGQTGYDGSSDAWKFQSNGGNYCRIDQLTNNNSVVTNTIYAKAGNVDFIGATATNGASGDIAVFNLSTGVVSSTSGSNVIDANIDDIGSGWYRCSITSTANSSGYSLWYVSDAGGAGSSSGDYVFIQDAQQNYGLIAQDYVETTTAPVSAGLLGDMPRLDYSGGATCPSLLLEPSRTNLITHSEYFDSWTKSAGGTGSNPVVTSNTTDTISPEGVNNASKIVFDVGAGTTSSDQSIIYIAKSGLTTGVDYTASVYLKGAVGGEEIIVRDTEGSYTKWTLTTEWARYEYTQTASATSFSTTLGIRQGLSGIGTINSSATIYAYGFVSEQGSYPTSYIPTYGAAANRGADVASKSSATALIGQTEGTLFVEMNRVNKSVDWNFVSCLYNGATGDFLEFLWTSANTLVGHWIASGVYNSITASGYSGNVKMALAYKSGSYAMYVNGVQIGTNTASDVPSCDLVDIGWTTRLSGYQVSDGIKQALLFKTRLTNAELAALTTI